MKILIVSDAWLPQLNGVVRSLQATRQALREMGHSVLIIGPERRRWAAIPMPGYTEIVLEFFAKARLKQVVDVFTPDSIHIATEGPLGWAMRSLCLEKGWTFTTAYHTRFPQYIAARMPLLPAQWVERLIYAILRRFHRSSGSVMVATRSIREDLARHGFVNLAVWSRGVDANPFAGIDKDLPLFAGLARPILLYVGRVSVEKNIEAFLSLATTGTKVVIGDGPDMPKMARRFPLVRFMGRMEGEALALAYAAADLFVFPSKSDTFGLVLLEACAAGLRIAAYPAPGPRDIFEGEAARDFVALETDLQAAVDKALTLPDSPKAALNFAKNHAWKAATAQFLVNLCPITANKALRS